MKKLIILPVTGKKGSKGIMSRQSKDLAVLTMNPLKPIYCFENEISLYCSNGWSSKPNGKHGSDFRGHYKRQKCLMIERMIQVDKKNIIYIYADDLGRGMLSCYGQKIIKTTNIDRLAERGMRFTNFCGTAFCAPARASLICGIHDAHAGRWTYTPGAYYKKISTGEVTFEELQEVLQHVRVERTEGDEYLATVAKKAGYVTAEIGKLEWGFSTTPAEMKEHGWDYHYGYYDHIQCHGYYPPFLFENGEMIDIEGNTDPQCGRPEYSIEKDDVDVSPVKDMTGRAQYSQDLFDEKILQFIRDHKDERFFLFHPSQLPHSVVFYPDVHPQVKDRNDLTQVEKEYASMVLRLDETVGKIMNEVERMGLMRDTLIIFAADNGHNVLTCKPGRSSKSHQLDGTPLNEKDNPFRTETCGDVFNGNNGMAGLKFSNWNGGCVVPFIASCPGLIPEGTVCNTLASNYDTLATVADLVGVAKPPKTDGISYLPMLRGEADAPVHDYVVYACKNGPALVTKDGYKLRVYIPGDVLSGKEPDSDDMTNCPKTDYQLYDLNCDFEERHNIAAEHPEIVKKLKKLILDECDGNLYNGTPMAHHANPVIPAVPWAKIVKGVI